MSTVTPMKQVLRYVNNGHNEDHYEGSIADEEYKHIIDVLEKNTFVYKDEINLYDLGHHSMLLYSKDYYLGNTENYSLEKSIHVEVTGNKMDYYLLSLPVCTNGVSEVPWEDRRYTIEKIDVGEVPERVEIT